MSYKEIKSPKSFAEDGWDTIIDNVKIGNISVYEKNLKENTNNTKKINLTGFGEKTVRIANTSTPEECKGEVFSQTACGFVVEFVDIITEQAINSTNDVTNWENSEIREYMNNDILNSFPESIRENILTTYTVSGHEFGVNENYKTYDKLYLLSTKEVWGKEGIDNIITEDSAEAETRQLDYYKEIGVTTENFDGTIKYNLNNNSIYWWLRSQDSTVNNFFFVVYDDGDWQVDSVDNAENGVALAFRL